MENKWEEIRKGICDRVLSMSMLAAEPAPRPTLRIKERKVSYIAQQEDKTFPDLPILHVAEHRDQREFFRRRVTPVSLDTVEDHGGLVGGDERFQPENSLACPFVRKVQEHHKHKDGNDARRYPFKNKNPGPSTEPAEPVGL